MPTDRKKLRTVLLQLVPADGGTIGNGKLRQAIGASLGRELDESDYAAVRDALVAEGVLVKGQGRGGSVRRATTVPDDDAGPDTTPPLVLQSPEPTERAASKPARRSAPAAPRARERDDDTRIVSYRHTARRRNNPEVGMVDPDTDPEQPRTTWAHDPHVDPTLVWTGKAERTSFEVDTVSLHVHERIDPASILHAVRRRPKHARAEQPRAQLGLFSAPFENLPLRDAVDFYRHDRGWSNRLIAGDSLLVMNSLLQKEGMAGQVQTIYIDPPYGIKYGSNFQPFTNRRRVEDRKDRDLTGEPETLKAFRDTWELGIHSYLSYLRDRVLLAHALLHRSGSIFVQISDENLHHVKEILDEVFGPDNLVSVITTKKTGVFRRICGRYSCLMGQVVPGVAQQKRWISGGSGSLPRPWYRAAVVAS